MLQTKFHGNLSNGSGEVDFKSFYHNYMSMAAMLVM